MGIEQVFETTGKQIPSWDFLFCFLRGDWGFSAWSTIGSYFVIDYFLTTLVSPGPAYRKIGLFLRWDVPSIGLVETKVRLARLDYEQGREQREAHWGILRDLWELPKTEYSDLTVGKFQWFLHCFEHTHPNLFPGHEVYLQKRKWHRNRERESNGTP